MSRLPSLIKMELTRDSVKLDLNFYEVLPIKTGFYGRFATKPDINELHGGRSTWGYLDNSSSIIIH
jgi:hypothetical protein